MLSCFLCKQQFITIKTLFSHFYFKHSNHTLDLFFCAENKCSMSFNLKNYFRKHLQKHILEEKSQFPTSNNVLNIIIVQIMVSQQIFIIIIIIFLQKVLLLIIHKLASLLKY